MDTNIKSKKAGMEEGIMPIKSLKAGWRRDTLQTQHPLWNCSWIPWKKNNFCNGYQYKMQKSQDGGGNNAYKIFMSLVVERYIPNARSYVELFMLNMKIKNNFCNGHQYEMQKSRDGGGNNTYKIFTSRVEEEYIPNTISYVNCSWITWK